MCTSPPHCSSVRLVEKNSCALRNSKTLVHLCPEKMAFFPVLAHCALDRKFRQPSIEGLILKNMAYYGTTRAAWNSCMWPHITLHIIHMSKSKKPFATGFRGRYLDFSEWRARQPGYFGPWTSCPTLHRTCGKASQSKARANLFARTQYGGEIKGACAGFYCNDTDEKPEGSAHQLQRCSSHTRACLPLVRKSMQLGVRHKR